MKDWIDLIGRVFISLIFFWEAYDSIAYFESVQRTMKTYGLDWNPDLLLTLAIILLILGALFILIGYRASVGALMILIYWVPVTFIVYSFWNDPIPERRMQSIQFMKNIAIIGGLMIVLVNGSGRFSIKRILAASRPPKTKW